MVESPDIPPSAPGVPIHEVKPRPEIGLPAIDPPEMAVVTRYNRLSGMVQ